MSRPTYESAGDRRNQRHVLSKLERAFQLRIDTPWGEFSIYDGMFDLGDGQQGIVEVKVRKNERRKYPTYMLSKKKYDALIELTETGFIGAMLAVQWTDQLGVVAIPTAHSAGHGGRYDRNDPADQEPVVLIPVKDFKRIPE